MSQQVTVEIQLKAEEVKQALERTEFWPDALDEYHKFDFYYFKDENGELVDVTLVLANE